MDCGLVSCLGGFFAGNWELFMEASFLCFCGIVALCFLSVLYFPVSSVIDLTGRPSIHRAPPNRAGSINRNF